MRPGCDFDRIASNIAIWHSYDLLNPSSEEIEMELAHAAYMSRAAKSREAYDSLNAATEHIEAEQTKALKNKHFPVNPKR